MIDDELQILHHLFLNLGLTLTLAIILFGVYFYIARKRAHKVPLGVFVIFLVTVILYSVLLLDESDLFRSIKLWEPVYLWTRFAAYLGTAFLVIKAVDLLFIQDFLIAKKDLYIPDLVRLLIIFAGLALVALVSLRVVMGINIVALVAIPTAATAVIGFALQDTIKRFFAGLTLGKLVRVGDWVSVAGRQGRVTKVDLGHLTILTRDDDLVMIPNNIVLQQDIMNFNKPTTQHARSVMVDAAYGAPPLEVQQILVDAAKAVTDVLRDPAPCAFLSEFKDSSIEYRLKFWISEYAKAPQVDGQVLTYVWYAFQRHGIDMPFPQRTIHMVPPEDVSQTVALHRERILEALRRVDFLSVLSPEELNRLADQATIRLYLTGEAVVHQGEEGAEMFFILDGHAEVRVGEGNEAALATLHPLQFFGEMSLLTGERRSATIVAQTRLEVLVVGKEAIGPTLRNNPSLVEHMSSLLVQRKSELAAHQERLARRGDGEDREQEKQTLGARIRNFFGI